MKALYTGGSNDQTLILYDDVPIYNQAHAYGILSIFSGETVQSAEVSKGYISPAYGSRLSALTQIRTRDGDRQDHRQSLTVGTLSLAGTGACSFTQILARIAPLLIMPFAAAQFCRFLLPKTAKWIGDHSQISFYMWLASLLVIIGRTTAFIIDLRDASLATELWLAFAALAICLGQFKVGRMLGRRYGDAPAGGQSLGQKNTVLAVWMAQSFLDPISSIAPTAYIVWQNFVNSYQIWRKDRGK